MRGATEGSRVVRKILGNSFRTGGKRLYAQSSQPDWATDMQLATKQTWKPQFSLRLILVLCVVFGLLFAYAGSYYRISRRGMREAEEFGLAGFLYIPFREAAATHDLTRHYWLRRFYAPANLIDQRAFGAPGPIDGITWGLH